MKKEKEHVPEKDETNTLTLIGPHWAVNQYILIVEGPKVYKVLRFTPKKVDQFIKKLDKDYKSYQFVTKLGPKNKEEIYKMIKAKVESFKPKLARDIFSFS